MNPYQYVVLRAVPRVEREEFVNVGVVLYCQAADVLAVEWRVDADRLRALDESVDAAAVTEALRVVELVCAADPEAGAASAGSAGVRFGFLKAPRSTVLQPGPVHGGVTIDPVATLHELRERLVD